MDHLWNGLAVELDSLKIALQQTDVQKMLNKDFEHIKSYESAHRQIDAIALFGKRAAEFLKELEKSGALVKQKRWNESMDQPEVHTLGSQARVVFPMFKDVELDGKVDTGATSSSLHATNVKMGDNRVSFMCDLLSPNVITLPTEGTQEVHSADFGGDQRPVVRFDVVVDGKPLKGVMFNLNDRSKMDAKLLIGQDVLKAGNFQVDVNKNEEQPEENLPDEGETVSSSIGEEQIYEAIKLLADSDITISEFVKYLQTEAVNRIKE